MYDVITQNCNDPLNVALMITGDIQKFQEKPQGTGIFSARLDQK